jgi:hypothetical protein
MANGAGVYGAAACISGPWENSASTASYTLEGSQTISPPPHVWRTPRPTHGWLLPPSHLVPAPPPTHGGMVAFPPGSRGGGMGGGLYPRGAWNTWSGRRHRPVPPPQAEPATAPRQCREGCAAPPIAPGTRGPLPLPWPASARDPRLRPLPGGPRAELRRGEGEGGWGAAAGREAACWASRLPDGVSGGPRGRGYPMGGAGPGAKEAVWPKGGWAAYANACLEIPGRTLFFVAEFLNPPPHSALEVWEGSESLEGGEGYPGTPPPPRPPN